MLGAKAVVFIEPETTNRGEAENKFLTVPANIPRFWINKANAEKIKAMIVTAESKNEKVSVRLKSTMTWERRTGQNIRGYLEGGDLQLKDEMVVINAYYDSMSVVPAIAPQSESFLIFVFFFFFFCFCCCFFFFKQKTAYEIHQ